MRIAALSVFLFSLSALSSDYANELPNGRFAGEGHWKASNGWEEDYKVSVEINGNEIRSSYEWDSGSATIIMSFQVNEAGLLDVAYGENLVGQGSCNYGICQYEINVGGVYVQANLTFSSDGLVSVGQKRVGDLVISWEEELHQVTDESF
jgi:hypothetical protein